jgi:hypothetical protein
MKQKLLLLLSLFILVRTAAHAQIDFENIDPTVFLGKVITLQNGLSPKFFVNDIQIPKLNEVAKILGIKNSDEINRLFNTFKTGHTIYKVALYTGAAVSAYGTVRSISDGSTQQGYKTAIVTGLGAIGSGLVVKLLTKGAATKAVDIFNNTARRKLRNIFKVGAAQNSFGVAVYATL